MTIQIDRVEQDTHNRALTINDGRVYMPSRPIVVSDPALPVARKINGIARKPPSTTGVVSAGTPKVILSCSAVESPSKAQGRTFSEISVSFTRDTTDKNFAGVNIWAKGYKGNSNWTLLFAGGESPVSFLEETTKETIVVAVQSFSGDGTVSAFSSAPTCTVTLNGVISAPPAPNVSGPLTATPLGYQFTFDQIVLSAGTQDVIDSYKVYRASSNSFGAATLVHTFRADPTAAGSIVFQDRTGGQQVFYYWVTAVNTIGLESSPTAAQSIATTSGQSGSKDSAPINNSGLTTATSAILTQFGVTKIINSSAFTVQYGFGQVSYNSASVTPANYGQYYIYFSDPAPSGGAITLLATTSAYNAVSNDGYQGLGSITTAVGGGGSGGGGGGNGDHCFTPETMVRGEFGNKRFDQIVPGDKILTAAGTWVPVYGILKTMYKGPVHRFSCGRVTPGHHFLVHKEWLPASKLYSKRELYDGPVMNLLIKTADKEPIMSPVTEHSYTLANGDVAHNLLPS